MENPWKIDGDPWDLNPENDDVYSIKKELLINKTDSKLSNNVDSGLLTWGSV